jgi:hypothetical protein
MDPGVRREFGVQHMRVAVIGIGKMGAGIARNLV